MAIIMWLSFGETHDDGCTIVENILGATELYT